jgi:hypothetical protein
MSAANFLLPLLSLSDNAIKFEQSLTACTQVLLLVASVSGSEKSGVSVPAPIMLNLGTGGLGGLLAVLFINLNFDEKEISEIISVL